MLKNDDLSQKLAHGSSAVQLSILDPPYCTLHFSDTFNFKSIWKNDDLVMKKKLMTYITKKQLTFF